jgi:CysZ protein
MFKNTLNGIKAYGNSLKIIRELGLWKYFGIPILISLLTGVLIGILTWVFYEYLGFWISKIWIWDWGAETFRTISNIIGGMAIIAFGLIAYKHIVMALSAPFMGLVSEKIEAYMIGEDPELSNTFNWGLIWRGIRINLRNLMMELLLTIPILLIGFIPIIGFISTPLLFLVQSYYAGFGNMDYTLERHLSYRQSVQFVRNHKGIALGNGMVFMVILLIPILGIILVLPLSVTAASSETINVVLDSKSRTKRTTFN